MALASLAAAALVALLLQPWSYGDADVFAGGNDPVWQQAMFQVHGQTGVFGASDHLAWPVGADPWRLPQMGALVGTWAWVTVGWLGMATAASVLWALVLLAALNAAAIVYFLRGLVGSRRPGLVVVLAISLAAATHGVAYQLNIAALFPVALTLGVLVRLPTLPRHRRRRRATIGVVAVVAAVAPLWWIVVLVFLLPVIAVPSLVRGAGARLRELALVWGALALGLALQTAVFLVARSNGPGADENRTEWASNAFFGHLSDLLVGSPLLESTFPGTVERLDPGSSLTRSFGLPMLLTAAVALVVLLAVPPRRLGRDRDTSVLAAATIGATLFWLGGGLGNLQAALAVLAGTVSPARTWLRMLAVLAIVGAGWLVALARAADEGTERNPAAPSRRRRAWPTVAAGLLVLGLVGDLLAYDQPRFYRSPAEEPSASGVVEFLRSERAPCPVAQLPNESSPNARIPAGIAGDLKYHEMEPYILAPEFSWTAGSYDERDLVHLATLDHTVTDDDLPQLEAWGYCAVLYDVAQGARAVELDADVEGRELSLTAAPSYVDPSYELHLLDGR